MTELRNFKELITYLSSKNHGKEAIQNFLFSMYGIEQANVDSEKSCLVIIEDNKDREIIDQTLKNLIPEIDEKITLDNQTWYYQVYINSDYGEGIILYGKEGNTSGFDGDESVG